MNIFYEYTFLHLTSRLFSNPTGFWQLRCLASLEVRLSHTILVVRTLSACLCPIITHQNSRSHGHSVEEPPSLYIERYSATKIMRTHLSCQLNGGIIQTSDYLLASIDPRNAGRQPLGGQYERPLYETDESFLTHMT